MGGDYRLTLPFAEEGRIAMAVTEQTRGHLDLALGDLSQMEPVYPYRGSEAWHTLTTWEDRVAALALAYALNRLVEPDADHKAILAS